MASNWKTKVAQRFDRKADRYHNNSDLQDKIAQELITHLPDIKPSASILEIGCGTGKLTQKLLQRYPSAQFHITDISAKMLGHAKSHIGERENVTWHVMDGEALEPLDTAQTDTAQSYDLIVSNMAFQWFETPKQSLENLRKHLSTHGQLFYSVPSSQSFKEWRTALSALSLDQNAMRDIVWPGIYQSDDIPVPYGSTLEFLKSLKEIGADLPSDDYKPLSPAQIRSACVLCDQDHSGQVTWRILYGKLSA